jgi:hypothetical protein
LLRRKAPDKNRDTAPRNDAILFTIHFTNKTIITMNSPSRPTTYTEELGQRICSIIATSTNGLIEVSIDTQMPELTTIVNWLTDPEMKDFQQAYNRARTIQADLLADEMVAIADTALADGFNAAQVSLVKLRVDTREWKASKLAPRKYGTKPDAADAEGDEQQKGCLIKWGDNVIAL